MPGVFRGKSVCGLECVSWMCFSSSSFSTDKVPNFACLNKPLAKVKGPLKKRPGIFLRLFLFFEEIHLS